MYHLEGKFPLWLQRYLYQPEFMLKVCKNRRDFLLWVRNDDFNDDGGGVVVVVVMLR